MFKGLRTGSKMANRYLLGLAVFASQVLLVNTTHAQQTTEKAVSGLILNPSNVVAASTSKSVLRSSKLDTKGWMIHGTRHTDPSVAYLWMDVIQEAAARRIDSVGAKPTVISREMAISVTAMYDAWAAYDRTAVGTRLRDELRTKVAESDRREAQKTAMSYATYRALCYVYPEQVDMLTADSRQFGVDPYIASTSINAEGSTSTSFNAAGSLSEDTWKHRRAAAIGIRAAEAVIAYRKTDGSNQEGDMPGCDKGAYSDYTGYKCVNPDPTVINDPDCWQPIPFDDGKGGTVLIGYLTPHWGNVKSLGLDSNDQFRAPPPPKVGSEQLKQEVDQLIEWNATLTPEQKAIVEFMRDGPRSTGQSGHWLRFAQDVSARDNYDLDKDVKLFFCIANVCSDAFISCWETKRYYNTSRPWTLVRHYYKGQMVRGWGGPCKGTIELPAELWHPYSPSTFVTPPFPAYTSGHATVSGASAKILELLTASDRFECIERRTPGSLTEGICDVRKMQAIDGVPDFALPQALTQELALPTFSGTADMAALSRALGGYHIMTDNTAGLDCGRRLAVHCLANYQRYFDGTAEPRE